MKRTGNHKGLICLLLATLSMHAAGEVKPLTEYREVTRMWMGVEEGYIRPAGYQQFRMDKNTEVVIHAKDQQILKKGEHWATVDPEQLELERRSTALEDARAVSKELDALQDAKDNHVRKIRELHEAQAQLGNIREILKDGGLDPMFGKRVKEAVVELEQKIAILDEQTSEDSLKKELELIREDYKLQAAQRAKKLRAFEKLSILVAKDGGKLQLGEEIKRKLDESTDPEKLIWVDNNELIASVSNESSYEITVSANGPLLTGIPTEQLLVFFQDPQTGQLIEGEYLRTDERDNGKQIQRDFIFKTTENGLDAAKRASGSSNTVHVFRKFDKPYRIVLKKDLVFSDPEQLENAGWVGLVQKLWPGSKVIQVASQSIAIDPGK